VVGFYRHSTFPHSFSTLLSHRMQIFSNIISFMWGNRICRLYVVTLIDMTGRVLLNVHVCIRHWKSKTRNKLKIKCMKQKNAVTTVTNKQVHFSLYYDFTNASQAYYSVYIGKSTCQLDSMLSEDFCLTVLCICTRETQVSFTLGPFFALSNCHYNLLPGTTS